MGLSTNIPYAPEEWHIYLTKTNVLLDELWRLFPTAPEKITTFEEAQSRFIELVSEKFYVSFKYSVNGNILRQFDEMFHCFRKELSYEERRFTVYVVNRFFFPAITNHYSNYSGDPDVDIGFDLEYLIYRFGPIVYYLNEQEIIKTLNENPLIKKSAAVKRRFYLKRYRKEIERAKFYCNSHYKK